MADATITATLVATTAEAERALGGKKDVRLKYCPFKVGRESRTETVAGSFVHLRGTAPPLNDLYLVEPSWADLMQVSREHFMIDQFEGEFVLIDRGSSLGTLVNGQRVGGQRQGGRVVLHNGDLITVGNERSEYIFRFQSPDLPPRPR